MINELYEKAKQAVAEKHGCENWISALKHAPYEDDIVFEAAELYAQWMCNEAVKEKEVIIEKVSSRLSDLFQLLVRQSANHPEMFSELDQMRIGAAKTTIEKYAKPFDPRDVLRQSSSPLPFPQQPEGL